MKRFFQRLLNPGGKPVAEARQPVLTLAAFGKHPGWDDYLGKGVDTGIGVDTEALADAKEALHEAGIRRQIDSGGWQNLPAEKRLEGFDHSFLWIRAGHVIVGRLWSSSDGKGRLYPMVLCVDGEGITPDYALAKVMPELERLRAACVAATSAEQVTAECRAAQDVLRSFSGDKELVLMPPPLSVEVRRQFLEHADLGPERIGLLRALHEIGATGQPGERRNSAGAGFPSRHLRLPLAADSPLHALLLWAEFLRCALPASTPLLLISRGGMGWMDAILGEPAGDDLFCLQASTQALALVSHVPYELSPELKPRLQEIEAGFLRVDSAGAGGHRSAAGVNASAPPTLPGAAPAGGKKSPLLFLGGLLLIGVVVLGLWAVSRNRGSPPAAGPLAIRSNSPATGATVLAQDRVRTNAADSAREAVRLKEEAAQRRLVEEKKAAVEKAEREQQELLLRAAAAQASKVAEAAAAKAPVAVKAGNEAVQVAAQNRAEDEKAQARAQENDADLAQISLAQGNYQRVLELCRKWPGVARFQPVLAKAVAETNLLQQMTDYLLAGNHATMLASRLPENDKFKELVSKAAAEKKVLDQAAGEFAEGNYAFLQREQVQSLKAKAPFQKLL